MPEALDSIPYERREHPLSVHGVVLFPAAPGASVIHVDAAEYVSWLQDRVSTLKSQLTLCRASLPAELQSAIDALNIGEGLTPPSIITPVSSGRETADRTPIHSAFVPIDSAPDQRNHVFKPFTEDEAVHQLPPTQKPVPPPTKKIPFLKRMFDRSSSSSKLVTEPTRTITPTPVAPDIVEESSPDRPRESMSLENKDQSPKITRRRRSISLDNFGLVKRDSRSGASFTTRRRGSFGVDTNGVFRVAYPVPQRAASVHGKSLVNPLIASNYSSNSTQGYDQDDDSISAEHVDDGDYYTDDEVVESNSDCGSIDPVLAAAASCGPKDFEPYDAEQSIDSMSERDLDYIQNPSPTSNAGAANNFRALSDGATLTQTHAGGERKRKPSANARTVVSPFPTSSATSLDSTDRSAAAEALAKRTNARASFSAGSTLKDTGSSVTGQRRSFSLDAHQFPRRGADESKQTPGGFAGLGASLMRSKPILSVNDRDRERQQKQGGDRDRERSGMHNTTNKNDYFNDERMNVVIDGGIAFGRTSRRTSIMGRGGDSSSIAGNRRMDSAIKRLTRRRANMSRVLSHPEPSDMDADVTGGDETVKRSASGGPVQPQYHQHPPQRFPGRISIGGKGVRELQGQGRKLKITGLFRRKNDS